MGEQIVVRSLASSHHSKRFVVDCMLWKIAWYIMVTNKRNMRNAGNMRNMDMQQLGTTTSWFRQARVAKASRPPSAQARSSAMILMQAGHGRAQVIGVNTGVAWLMGGVRCAEQSREVTLSRSCLAMIVTASSSAMVDVGLLLLAFHSGGPSFFKAALESSWNASMHRSKKF